MAALRKGNGKGRTLEKKNTLTTFTCPDCHGTIWEVEENGEVRFECRVGHSYSPEAMREAADEDVERSLWIALRTLEEGAAIDQRLADLSSTRRRENAHAFYSQKARERKRHASILREFLLGSRQRQTEAEGDEGKRELERVS